MLAARNIWDLIVRRADETPEREMAVDESGRRMTFGEYRDRCERAAAGLAARGVGDGTVVSWIQPTTLEAMVLFGALRRLGAVQNPILPIYREREVGFIVHQAGTRVLVTPSTWRGFDYEAMARAVTEGTGTEVVVSDRALPDGDPATLPPPPDDDMNTATGDVPVRFVYYTSGTTAEPKGARHGDRSLRAASVGMSERLGLAEDDRFAFVFPITHIAGGVYIYAAVAYGLTFVLDEAFDPATTIDLLRREDITQGGAGTFFHQVYLKAQQDLPEGEKLFPHVRTFPGGGAPKPPSLHYALKDAFGVGVVSGYGMTEAPILTMNRHDAPDEVLADTEGPAVAGTTLRIVTLDGKDAGPGEEGEVRAKGPQVTLGYVDPALDADAFDEQGWFRTGDLGTLDADGNLTITGRLKDVIIRKGENISAKEVEDLLFTHPQVADVAVVGLPDDERGERACAVVVAPPGADPITFDEMTRHLLDAGLITRKLPEQLEVVDALPRNPSGKIVKFELQQRFAT
ncbi:MAG TPA: AMP-binding protein [Acidimicrobiales bacterium]|nr:AMP-binding protein [Acidimicrobiales bacterium]